MFVMLFMLRYFMFLTGGAWDKFPHVFVGRVTAMQPVITPCSKKKYKIWPTLSRGTVEDASGIARAVQLVSLSFSTLELNLLI